MGDAIGCEIKKTSVVAKDLNLAMLCFVSYHMFKSYKDGTIIAYAGNKNNRTMHLLIVQQIYMMLQEKQVIDTIVENEMPFLYS